jgi:hypothetical protein
VLDGIGVTDGSGVDVTVGVGVGVGITAVPGPKIVTVDCLLLSLTPA